MARKVPEINAGSMADIAFLLLIFFLVATTMDVDTGIIRQLPPPLDPNTPPPPPIKERNVFVVLVNANDELLVENQWGSINKLKDQTKDFLKNPSNNPDLSEFKMVDIPLLGGETRVSKGVISLRNDRSTSYDMYIQVQNELAAAVRELRDELSMQHFGRKFDDLKNEDQVDAIKKALPIPISEAEPKDIGGPK